MPVVMLNAAFHCDNVYCVMCDDQLATMEATQYLIDTGRKNILYLYHSKNYSGRKKLAGYHAGLASPGHCRQRGADSVFQRGQDQPPAGARSPAVLTQGRARV